MTRIDKGDNPTQVVSHLISARLGTIQTEKNLAMTYQSREKYTITVSGQHAGRRLLDQFSRAQDKGLRFWQTRSHAVIVYSSVPADCIYKVISQKGERTLFERLSTPRPAPKIALKGAWQSQQQQQQQDTSESASSRRKLVQREEQGNPTDIPELPSARKLKRSTGSLVQEEQPESKVDLRIEGLAQDVILEDEERMGHIQEVVEKIRNGFHTESVLEDLGKPEKLHDVQRGIQSHSPRNGQHQVVRVGTNDQNRPVSFMLETLARGIDLV